jgi:hypothetical protein
VAGEQWLQVVQVGKETTPGTAVVASRRLYVAGDFSRQRAVNLVEVSTGTRDNQRDSKLRSVKAGAKLSMPLGADEITEWLLATIQGAATPVTALGASTWTLKPSATLDTQTYEFFDGYRPWQLRGALIDELKLSGVVDGDTRAEASIVGRELTAGIITGSGGTNEVQSLVDTGASAGTFTLTFLGQTTTAIAYNAASAAVQAALEALPSIGTGNVLCAGGALPTAVSITFQGALAKQPNLPLITATSTLTGGTAVITRTTAGVLTTPLADRVPNYAEGWELLFYADAFGATPGTTVVPGTIVAWEVLIKNNVQPKYFGDNTLATGAVTLGKLDVTVALTLEANALAMTEYEHWDNNVKRLVRLAIGNNGAVIGTSALKPLITIDVPLAWGMVDLTPEDKNTKVYKFTGNYIYDPTNAFGLQVKVQNARATAY